MKISYTYCFSNESITVEIEETDYDVLISLDREEKNLNRKETRRHVNMDCYESIDDTASGNPRLSRDAFEYRNGICSDSAEIAADLESKYTRQHIRNAMDKLKPQQRELIHLIYFEGVSVKDYAAKEGVDHSAISHRLQTAYKNLKKFL